MTLRRRTVVLALAMAPGTAALARSVGESGTPLRVGVDAALVDSGLARALQSAFGLETGISVRIVRAPALPLLGALADGEFDAALVNVPDAESRLEAQGLVYDRHLVARSEFVLVGPASRRRREAVGRDVAIALRALHDGLGADPRAPGAAVFLSGEAQSGSEVAEQIAWRAAGIDPEGPWHRRIAEGASLVQAARHEGAHAIVERGAWETLGGAPLGVLVEGDPRLVEEVHAMRSFRSPHPAGKLFIAWIAGPRGRAVAARRRGYRRVA